MIPAYGEQSAVSLCRVSNLIIESIAPIILALSLCIDRKTTCFDHEGPAVEYSKRMNTKTLATG